MQKYTPASERKKKESGDEARRNVKTSIQKIFNDQGNEFDIV
jgi:hypothetical protein